MKNKVIIGIVVLIILGAGAWYFVSQSNKGGMPYTPVVSENGTNMKTLAALLAVGKPVKCTVAPTADNGNMSGTFYIADGKMRSDYSVNTAGQTMSGHMIMMNQTSYSWLDGQATGYKMAVAPTNTNTKTNAPVANQGFDASKAMDYSCGAWNADGSEFALPANIKFTEFGTTGNVPMIPATNGSVNAGGMVNSGVTTGTAAECAACDQVPAAYKAQCKAALGCK
jgi:hypothetical protein